MDRGLSPAIPELRDDGPRHLAKPDPEHHPFLALRGLESRTREHLHSITLAFVLAGVLYLDLHSAPWLLILSLGGGLRLLPIPIQQPIHRHPELVRGEGLAQNGDVWGELAFDHPGGPTGVGEVQDG